MNYNIYFSPTGGTKKTVQFIGEKFQESQDIDISQEIRSYQMEKNDFCIVGVPSFGGRVPDIAIRRLKQLQGKDTPVLLVVTYGNRAYEDTLIELKDTLEKQGFICVGAMSIISEHSIVPKFGAGRPNQDDFHEIEEYIQQFKERLVLPYSPIEVPGNHPYKEFHTIPMHPKTNSDCQNCGLCAKLCPVNAIPKENPTLTDHDQCISCMRCVKICPKHARSLSSLKLMAVEQKLKKSCSTTKKNEFF